ncbi:hypothetical protein FISHEDRAFT_47090 [Fistulina hepatica ATCC 64428]|uniref:Uncharacterized protein n=1 Tax=Fistulina hepatica ATCC 64428 TaxID=1128425 RepID=A0A0D7A6B3_9AGAR|nr:hypothetical protein FISHEDRAFT_47090 [Fistulina hepatica ATCC 64428]
MPPRGGRVAPQFIATESLTPLAFERYWRDLEQHFDTAGVTDLRQKKQWAVHYPDVQTVTIMKGVAEYADNAITWDAYKKAIEKLYIGDTDDRQWTISDLTYLCGEATCKPFMSLYEFCAFKRSFTVIYSYLKGQNKLSDTEASHMLFATLDSHIINMVASRLAIVCQDHLPEVETDIRAGLCHRNHFHLVVLPSGAHCLKHIPGQTLRERIRKYHRLNPNQRADQMELDHQPNPAIDAVVPPAQGFMMEIASDEFEDHDATIEECEDDEEEAAFQAQLEELSGVQARNIQVKEPTIEAKSKAAGLSRPAYHNVAPIEDEATAREIYEAIMNGTTMIKTKDLLLVAPEVRRKVRKDTTTRCVNVPIAKTAKDTTKASQKSIADDPVVSYYQGHKGEGPPPAVCGATSLALRTVMPLVNNVEEVEGVLDGGCQIVAMSKCCASNLGIAWNPDECVNLQSANGVEDKTLGLARDVPFCFHSMTVYLQCHIVDTPAYDILLGRPFYKLTSAVTCSFVTGEESLTLKNPSNGKRLTFPTYRCGDAHYKVSAYTHAEFDEVEGPPTGFQMAST